MNKAMAFFFFFPHINRDILRHKTYIRIVLPNSLKRLVKANDRVQIFSGHGKTTFKLTSNGPAYSTCPKYTLKERVTISGYFQLNTHPMESLLLALPDSIYKSEFHNIPMELSYDAATNTFTGAELSSVITSEVVARHSVSRFIGSMGVVQRTQAMLDILARKKVSSSQAELELDVKVPQDTQITSTETYERACSFLESIKAFEKAGIQVRGVYDSQGGVNYELVMPDGSRVGNWTPAY